MAEVTIVDTLSGRVEIVDRFDLRYWMWGNGSCDCNRHYAFNPYQHVASKATCVGCTQYIIVRYVPGEGDEDLDLDHVTIADFNEDYPPEVVARGLAQFAVARA